MWRSTSLEYRTNGNHLKVTSYITASACALSFCLNAAVSKMGFIGGSASLFIHRHLLSFADEVLLRFSFFFITESSPKQRMFQYIPSHTAMLSHLQSPRTPSTSKYTPIRYSKSGDILLALGRDVVLSLWKFCESFVISFLNGWITGFFHPPNPSRRTMALGLTQPQTEMSTTNISGGKGRPVGTYCLEQCIPTFFLSHTPWLGFSFMSTPSLHYPRPSLKKVFFLILLG
jgi:hypothetical protein